MTQVTTTIPATAADAASPAAAWLKTPCPEWCAYPEDHPRQNLDGDRIHRSATLADVDLSLEPPVSQIMEVMINGRIELLDIEEICGPSDEEPETQRLSASVVQHYKAPGPDVVVDVRHEDGEFDLHLTLGEAGEFALGLLELVRAAKSA
jgi:hypothetical protein